MSERKILNPPTAQSRVHQTTLQWKKSQVFNLIFSSSPVWENENQFFWYVKFHKQSYSRTCWIECLDYILSHICLNQYFPVSDPSVHWCNEVQHLSVWDGLLLYVSMNEIHFFGFSPQFWWDRKSSKICWCFLSKDLPCKVIPQRVVFCSCHHLWVVSLW